MDLLLLIGITIISGFIGGKLSQKVKLPAVTGYIITGILLGPSLFQIFHLDTLNKMGIITDFALGIIAFIIGSDLELSNLKKIGTTIISILLIESFATFILISLGIFLLTRNIALSLILGSLGVATAPAGTFVVLKEYHAKGPLTTTLLAIVALDDSVAIVVYSFVSAFIKLLVNGTHITIQNIIQGPLIKIGLALVFGFLLGVLLGYLKSRIKNVRELYIIYISSIFICTGLANVFHFSLILSNLVVGITVSNISVLPEKRTSQIFPNITLPIYILFFVIAGAHLQIRLLLQMGLIGLIYILTRSIAKIGGSWLGAYISKANLNIRKYIGFGLFTQAGVAIGLAMIVARDFGFAGKLASISINTITATTIILEIIGPIGVKYAITKSGESGVST